MDGFLKGAGPDHQPMGFYPPDQLPFAYSLAKTFTVGNRWFSSAPCPTYPNRRFLLAGTAYGGITTSLNSLTDGSRPSNGTIFDRLSEHGISWRNYFTDIPMTAVWAWIALFLLEDLTYYWFHRISHERRIWWAAHVNHHSSQHYNLSTALRQTWTGGLFQWVLWLPLALVGFPPALIVFQKGVSLVYQFWIHTELVPPLPALPSAGSLAATTTVVP